MTASFVAVLPGPALLAPGADDVRAALLAAGARDVLSWADLAVDGDAALAGDASLEGDVVAVLFEHADGAELAAFAQLSDALASGRATGSAIVATHPVTDTLKLLDAEGRLCGTAERDRHRMPAPPIVASIGLLRVVQDSGPDPLAVLDALACRGVMILSAEAVRPGADPRRT